MEEKLALKNIITPDFDNTAFMRAVEFVCDTDEHIFLTGKAGAGKTTFLKYIRTITQKKCAVVAPTGIAAINAGGETIHSFLQLPFTPFVPASAGGFGTQPQGVEDKHSLLARLKLRDTKVQLLRKLQLLIVDEVSMVRADLLDAMDLVLRHVRKRPNTPFGGVQMLFIGDLYQLPPVVPAEDWDILRHYYDGGYFFDAHVLRHTELTCIELNKVYRQKDLTFIEMLNRIRTGQVWQEDIQHLNSRYQENLDSKPGYIMLCTHNQIADDINKRELDQLATSARTYEGKIENDFNTRNLPVDQQLVLKEGAQVMFIKNDVQNPRRYYNGKIGTVVSLSAEAIMVRPSGSPDAEPIKVDTETWRNVRYVLDQKTGSIIEDELGSYTQYPLRLAWAITVHKSQGLTLDRVIVDLNRSFAAGQVYVALSRCTSFEGLILRSRLNVDNIMVDRRVLAFAQQHLEEDDMDHMLSHYRRKAMLNAIIEHIAFDDLIAATHQLALELKKRKTGPANENQQLTADILNTLNDAKRHTKGFHTQATQLFNAGEHTQLISRKKAAVTYFATQVLQPLISKMDAHLQLYLSLTGVAKQHKMWKDHQELFKQKLSVLQHI